MKSSVNSKKIRKQSDKIAVLAVIFVWLIVGFLGFFQKFDLRLYDFFLGIRKPPEERNEILFVEIDNRSLDSLGSWPWSRDILANSLLRMKELGAATAVFDIEYLSPSKLGVNPEAATKIERAFDSGKANVSGLINQFAGAAVSGMYSKNELGILAQEIIDGYINPDFDSLKDSIYDAAYQDNDLLFARSLEFFGNAWLTVNVLDLDIKYDENYIDYVRKKCLFPNVYDSKGYIKAGNEYYLVDQGGDNKLGFCPAQENFIRASKGAGFTNIVLDIDGTRRRVELLSDQNGAFAAQLVFAPILDILKPERIERNRFTLKLKNARNPDTGNLEDIVIPLDSHGRMLVNWLNREFVDSFRRESVVMLVQLDEAEKNIVEKLEGLSSFQLWDEQGLPLGYFNATVKLLEDYERIKVFKEYLLEKCMGTDENGVHSGGGITEAEYEDYFQCRRDFFASLSDFVNGNSFDQMFARLEEMKDSVENYDEVFGALELLVDSLKNEEKIYTGTFNEKKEAYKDSFCIIGNTASSTTDLGTTPFNRAYPNVGTHANVYNTILTQNFIWEIDWFVGFILASLIAFLAVCLTGESSVFMQNAAGIFSILVAVGVPVLLMVFFQIYVPVVSPLLVSVFSYLVVVIIRFVTAEKDKGVLRNAFSTYLAPAVVEQIVKDPSKLKLGGEEKHMTALFSDIKSFSSFSELVTPAKLVSILNGYLGSMSDRILDEGGTIDKYIGDSIVSFFGAPVDLENPSWSACVSAIKMKETEMEFNRVNMASGLIPCELKTRIGINTGEMVVGNMGTSSKMNYTIMGDAVNLASRLEGVNKVYKSWIMCSDQTWNEANSMEKRGLLAARKLDKVRVVGRDESVQLWNILGFINELPDNVLEALAIYEKAMEKYENRDFKEAGKLFVKANALDDSDETPLVFAQRCREFIEKGVPAGWDGIVNMTSK